MTLTSSCGYYLIWILCVGMCISESSVLLGMVMFSCRKSVSCDCYIIIPIENSIVVDVSCQLLDGLDMKSCAAGLVDGKRLIGDLWYIGSDDEPSPGLFHLNVAFGALILEEADESFINTFYSTNQQQNSSNHIIISNQAPQFKNTNKINI